MGRATTDPRSPQRFRRDLAAETARSLAVAPHHQQEASHMTTTIRLGGRAARNLHKVLAAISATQALPPDVRANAAYWARAVRRRMATRDVRAAAWFLHAVGDARALPAAQRRSASYWGARLEASV